MSKVFTNYYQSSLSAGSGKSTTVYNQIAKSGRKTIIAVPRIDQMLEHCKLFNNCAILVNSKDCEAPVSAQLSDAISVLKTSSNKHVIFITHNGLLSYDKWSTINSEFDLVIDEYFEYFGQTEIPVSISSQTNDFWNLFSLKGGDEGFVQVDFTAAAKDRFQENDDVIFDSSKMRDVFGLSKNNILAIKRYDMFQQCDTLKVFNLINGQMFNNFANVTFLCDGFDSSPLYKHLTSGYDIKFQTLPIKPWVARNKELSQRVTIYQVSEQNPSMTLFNKLKESDFAAIAQAVNSVATDNTIWTVNSKFKRNLNVNGQYLTPKQAGTNEYKDSTTAVWLASMKTSNEHVKAAAEFIGIDRYDFDQTREFEPMHQFVTRTNVRVYNSNNPVNVVVFGPAQAEYLAKRYNIATKDIVKLNVKLSNEDKVVVSKNLSSSDRVKLYRIEKKLTNGDRIKEKDFKWYQDTAIRLARDITKFPEPNIWK
jgi:hypothetical protein